MEVSHAETTQRSRPERPITHDLQLHAAAHGLRDAVRPTQRLHLQCILGGAPREEAGFERVRRGWGGGRCGGRAPGCWEGDVVAEGVGETGGGGGALGGVREIDNGAGCGVGCLGWVAGGGGDTEGLFFVNHSFCINDGWELEMWVDGMHGDGRTIVTVVVRILFVRWYVYSVVDEIKRWLGRLEG